MISSIKKTWSWIKKQFKKILVGIGIVGIAFAAGSGVTTPDIQDKLANAPEITQNYAMVGSSFKKIYIKNPGLTRKGEVKDSIEITAGDKKELKPQINIKRWGEVGFTVKPPESLGAIDSRDISFEGNKIKMKTPAIDYQYFEVAPNEEYPEGAYKYEFILNSRPTTNVITQDIQMDGVKFYYQPPLTEEITEEQKSKGWTATETDIFDENGNSVSHRPENIVGSYAVYHESKGGMNDSRGKAYKVGKVGHIYRPHIIDAEGKETWGILNIENGIYSVEIPQDFLDKAVYPIKSNDTFGYTVEGGSGISIAINTLSDSSSKSFRVGYQTDLGESGTLDSVTGYFAKEDSSGAANITIFLNTEDNASNSHDEAASVEGNPTMDVYTNNYGPYTFTATGESLSADSYVLSASGDWEDIADNDNIFIVYDSGGTYKYYEDFANTGAYASSKEDPWTVSEQTLGPSKYSIYATYTPSGGGTTTTAPQMQTDVIIVE